MSVIDKEGDKKELAELRDRLEGEEEGEEASSSSSCSAAESLAGGVKERERDRAEEPEDP